MFDQKKFMDATFSPRTKKVEVKSLQSFFAKGEKPLFEVRGLEGAELAEVYMAVQKNQGVEQLLSQIASTRTGEKIEGIKAALGITDKVPSEIVKRLEMLVQGSVNPKIPLDVAVKICATFPIEFYELTNTITELTGLGKILGKQKPSGETRK